MRKHIERWLIKTHEVTQSRRYMWLVVIYGIVVLAGATHAFEPEYWQMRRVRKHIARIRPQWEAFQRAHPAFENVQLIAKNDMAWGVVFAATGKISLDAHLIQLIEFMWGTQPPSSVDASQVITDFSQAIPPPVMKKVSALTTDERRIELEVPAEHYPVPHATPPRPPNGPAGLINPGQPIHAEGHRTPSAEDLHR